MREQFLKLLAEHPGDINIGLIYADWLAEQGDPEEAYWRDPRIYTQAWTAIFDGYDDFCKRWDSHFVRTRTGDGSHTGGDGWIDWGHGDGNGRGNGIGSSKGNGYGDGYHDYYYYGDGGGSGSSGAKVGLPLLRKWFSTNLNVRSGLCLRFEVLMEGRYVLVCDQGFVLVGDVSPNPSDWQRVIVDHCATVREWGTERGLGQLALEGPQPETILDYEGSGVDVLRATILRAIPCNETAWEQYPESITKEAD